MSLNNLTSLVKIPGILVEGGSYVSRILSTEPDNLLVFPRLNDASGSAVALDSSANSYNGTHSGVTLGSLIGPDGDFSGDYDGLNDVTALDAVGLLAAIDPTELTVNLWIKPDSSVWTDPTLRIAFTVFANGNNFIQLRRTATNNEFVFRYVAGGTIDDVLVAGLSSSDWFSIGLTIGKTADEMKAYINGSQVGSTQTGLGVWNGGQPANINIGSGVGALFWYGGAALGPIWDKALTPSQMGTIGVI